MSADEQVEYVASKLYLHTFGTAESWNKFKTRAPDIAQIYRSNARVAIRAVNKSNN